MKKLTAKQLTAITPKQLPDGPLTSDQLRVLRKMRICPPAINILVQAGVRDEGYYVQFNYDLRTYNMYAALLCLEQYEEQGHYLPGTLNAILIELGCKDAK